MISRIDLDFLFFFFFNDTATTEIYTLSLHDALPISGWRWGTRTSTTTTSCGGTRCSRSEEHTSELQSHVNLVCRLLLEKKKKNPTNNIAIMNVKGNVIDYTVHMCTIQEKYFSYKESKRYATCSSSSPSGFFFFNYPATTEIYTLSLHDALPISFRREGRHVRVRDDGRGGRGVGALRRNGGWILGVPGPVRHRHRGADADELRFRGGEPRRAERSGVQRGRGQAAEVAHAAAQERRLRTSGPAGQCPGEADPGRQVQFARDPVGAHPEQRIDRAIVGRGAAEAGGLEARDG